MTEQKLLPPWHPVTEKPDFWGRVLIGYWDNPNYSKYYKCFTWDDLSTFWDEYLVKWCYLDDLISLAEQSTRSTGDVQILIEGLIRLTTAEGHYARIAGEALTAYEATKKGGAE